MKIGKPMPQEFVTLPENIYPARLKKVTEFDTEYGGGLRFLFAILSKKYKKAAATATLWLKYDDEGEAHFASSDAEAFYAKMSGGASNPFDLKGERFRVLVKNTKNKKNPEIVYNTVTEVLPYEAEGTDEEDDGGEEKEEKKEEKKKSPPPDEEEDDEEEDDDEDDDEDDEPKSKKKHNDADDFEK